MAEWSVAAMQPDDSGMMNPNKSGDGSPSQVPKLRSRARQYVDVNDLRQMLKLGLGLHTLGDPLKRLNTSLTGMARLAQADAWAATVLALKPGSPLFPPLIGGKESLCARADMTRIESDFRNSVSSIGKLVAASRRVPGRVLAAIEQDDRRICSVLRHEQPIRGRSRITCLSIYRARTSVPFIERERRMIELFHSQTAWLLLQVAE